MTLSDVRDWAVAACIVFVAGTAVPPILRGQPQAPASECPGVLLGTGPLRSAEHEVVLGYYSVGESTVMLNTQSTGHQHLAERRGQLGELVWRPLKCRPELETLGRDK